MVASPGSIYLDAGEPFDKLVESVAFAKNSFRLNHAAFFFHGGNPREPGSRSVAGENAAGRGEVVHGEIVRLGRNGVDKLFAEGDAGAECAGAGGGKGAVVVALASAKADAIGGEAETRAEEVVDFPDFDAGAVWRRFSDAEGAEG